MTEETRPGFLANYKIVRPGPPRLGPARNLKTRPGPGPARIRPNRYHITESDPVPTKALKITIKTYKPLNPDSLKSTH